MSLLDSMDSMDSMGGGRRKAPGRASEALLQQHAAVVGWNLKSPPTLSAFKLNAVHAAWSGASDGMPDAGFARELSTVQSSVRIHMASLALADGLVFELNPAAGTAPCASAALHTWRSGTKTAIATLTRPAYSLFTEQLRTVFLMASSRETNMPEIVDQAESVHEFWAALLPLASARTPATLELIEAAQSMASAQLQRFKLALACPRPVEYSPSIMPIIDTPAYAAFPSGHATQAFLVARLLSALALPAGAFDPELQAVAIRIGQNREIAGVHFPADTSAGRVLGECLAEYVLCVCRGKPSGQIQPRHFDGANFYTTNSGTDASLDADLKTALSSFDVGSPGSCGAQADPLLVEMWARAAAEWR